MTTGLDPMGPAKNFQFFYITALMNYIPSVKYDKNFANGNKCCVSSRTTIAPKAH